MSKLIVTQRSPEKSEQSVENNVASVLEQHDVAAPESLPAVTNSEQQIQKPSTPESKPAEAELKTPAQSAPAQAASVDEKNAEDPIEQQPDDALFQATSTVSSAKADRFCGQCGQKNFRPHRTLKALFIEFIEDWLGYDSKIYKTSRALFKPAFLSLDYFSSSHHKNHYITPIRLFLVLSIIFFVLTQFAGFNLNDSTDLFNDEAKQELNAPESLQISFGDGNSFILSEECVDNPGNMVNFSIEWFDKLAEERLASLCKEYFSIDLLPEEKQAEAKVQFGFDVVQQAIDIAPQVMFASLPLLALLLSVFYIIRRRLFVEHLVLLLHSHCLLFTAILLGLGWYQLEERIPQLDVIPMAWIIAGLCLVYLYLSQKRFYQQGHIQTMIKFVLFGILYAMIILFLVIVSFILGALSF